MPNQTLRQLFSERLVEHGLWPNEAGWVIDRYLLSAYGEPMRGRMDDACNGYPPQLLEGVWPGLKEVAIEWIDANAPQHFARAILAAMPDTTLRSPDDYYPTPCGRN